MYKTCIFEIIALIQITIITFVCNNTFKYLIMFLLNFSFINLYSKYELI